MSLNSWLPILIVLSALIPGVLIFCIAEHRLVLRRMLNLGASTTCLILIGLLINGVYAGEVFEARLPLLPSIDLVLHADALSLLFVSLSGLLWLVTTIYAMGYLENTKHRGRFFGFFSLCVAATLGIALAGNLITFLIFYELLTLTTYPLVVHKGNAASLRAGRIYLAYTMLGGALLLAGVVWLKALAGPLDFTTTGILSSMPQLDPVQLKVIFALMIAGLGVKAALVPFHGWLPIAMAAPAPVSALLHAVAVVKAGAFGIIRVVYDVYGIEFARDLGMTTFLMVAAAFTIVYGSLMALRQDDIKKRLAYSTVSQVSYIALGTAIAGPIATIGGMVHLVHQGVMKITLFFCAGSLAETLGIHKVSEINGAGRRMPITMAAFTIAALGMIGLPPIAGFVSKWYLGTGAIEVGAYWVLIVLAVSSILNALYFLPILYAAWFKDPVREWPDKTGFGEAHWMLWVPPAITATLAIAVGLLASLPSSPLSWVELISAREYGRELLPVPDATNYVVSSLEWVIIVPLLVAAGLLFPGSTRFCIQLAPYAAVPALAVALLVSPESNLLPGIFFGGVLSVTEQSKIMLLLAALLWLVAGIYGNDYLKGDPNIARYTLFFLLCMTGSFGLTLSQDIFGFISFFTLMSFAAYGLVIHSATTDAIQAGKIYIRWVVIGEVLLFAALAGLAIAGNGTDLISLDKSAQPQWVSWLFLLGFGIKAGLLATHFWLPRAHPVAPVPASALLSGLMVKAGLLGWWRFLPMGEVAVSEAGNMLIILGLIGTFLAVLAGLVQSNMKALLAYSTISQMGIMAAGVGVGLVWPSLWPLLSVSLLLYAVHHGLAKAALFLSVGLAPLLSRQWSSRWLVWLVVLIPVFALVGFPLTSGALAKSALKQSVSEVTWLTQVLSVSVIGTTLLMLRFIELLRQAGQQATTIHKNEITISSARFIATTVLALLVIKLVYWLPQSTVFASSAVVYITWWSLYWPVIGGVLSYLLIRPVLMNIAPVSMSGFMAVIKRSQKAYWHSANRAGQKSLVYLQKIIRRIEAWQNKLYQPVRAKVSAIQLHPAQVFIGVLLCLSLVLI